MTMRTLCVTTALLALATQSPGTAKSIIIQDSAAPFARVSYADLNLSSHAGRRTLEFRVRRAADSLCFQNCNPDLSCVVSEHNSYRTAITGAQPQIEAAV